MKEKRSEEKKDVAIDPFVFYLADANWDSRQNG